VFPWFKYNALVHKQCTEKVEFTGTGKVEWKHLLVYNTDDPHDHHVDNVASTATQYTSTHYSAIAKELE
jgi:hypothetical protein